MHKQIKIAIHRNQSSFSDRWVAWCEANHVAWKTVDCYSNSIIEDLADCDALMWHHNHALPKDILFAKQLLTALAHSGKVVFPDHASGWHFDDKLAQKYLFESHSLPMVQSWAFFDKKTAFHWAANATWPKVAKLRGGAGSTSVRLLKSRTQAESYIAKAFGAGHRNFDPVFGLKDRWRAYRSGKAGVIEIAKGLARFVKPPESAKTKGREQGYVYFQEFLPGNDGDIRVVVVEQKAFGIKRLNRDNDFRASGSGKLLHAPELIDTACVRIAFEAARKMNTTVAAFDFLYADNHTPQIVEISFGFTKEGYDRCPGYWSDNMEWHEGSFDPYGWMVQSVIRRVQEQNSNAI